MKLGPGLPRKATPAYVAKHSVSTPAKPTKDLPEMNHLRLPVLAALLSSVAFAPADGAAAAPAVETKTVTKQNGIKRPDDGTVTGKLWDIADRISEAKGAPALRKEVTDAYMAEVPAANIATANTQYARWVTYFGVGDLIKTQRKAENEAAAAAKTAEKDKAKAEAAAKKEADAKATADAKAAKEAEAAAKAKAKEDEKARKAQEKADKKAADDKAKADAKAAAAAK